MKMAGEKKFELVNKTRPNAKEIQDLIKSGIDINCRNERGETPFMKLMKESNAIENFDEIVRLFLQNGVNVNAKGFQGRTALHWVCAFYQKDNLMEIVQILIEHGASAKEKEMFGRTALHLVCSNYENENLLQVIPLLIQNGNEVNEKNNSGWTALHLVCLNYRKDNLKEIIALLIEHGADVKERIHGSTALDIVKESTDFIKNKNEIMKLLGD